MNEKLYMLQQTAEGIRDLMAELVALQRDCHRCCRAVSLTPPQAPSPPDDPLLNRKAAAGKLLKSEQQVYRYRITGRLAYVQDVDTREIRYALSELLRLYIELWGKKPTDWP